MLVFEGLENFAGVYKPEEEFEQIEIHKGVPIYSNGDLDGKCRYWYGSLEREYAEVKSLKDAIEAIDWDLEEGIFKLYRDRPNGYGLDGEEFELWEKAQERVVVEIDIDDLADKLLK